MGRKKTIRLITLNVMFVIFSLASAFTGTYAWFNATRNAAAAAESFSIINRECTIESVTLYKFEYKSYVVDSVVYYDYISPSEGRVETYSFDFTRNRFGTTKNGEWVPVNEMNLYDPDAYRISGSLSSLNCNAVYKVTFSSTDFIDAELHVSALRKTIPVGDNILLSTCADFNVFVESDLNPQITYPIPANPEEDTNDYRLYKTSGGRPILVDGSVVPAWHPNYKSTSFEPEEEIYYKMSRLAALSVHDNFYSEEDPESTRISLTDDDPISATFVDNKYSVYLNVNYAPSTLTRYNGMDMNDRVRAVYDCGFSFYFE